MIAEFITGLFVGISLAFIAAYLFFFYAKRKGWVDIRVHPRDNVAVSERELIDDTLEKLDEVNTRLVYLENQLSPYLRKKE